MKSENNFKSKPIQKKKELRCSVFEYTTSGSDEENDKVNINFHLNKKEKTKKEKNNKLKQKKIKVYLSRYIRMILFLLLLIFNVIIDLDSGIIVSSYKSFTKDLNMNDIKFGSLSSISNIGEIISLLFYMNIINKNHRKLILVVTSFFHGLSFFGYFINNNYYYIIILKFFISFCKVFITVYIPVWIDQFGIKKYKTLLLTILYMVSSLGRIIGAWIGTVIFKNDWKKAFICCGLIFFILSFLLFVIPQKYFSTRYMFIEQQKDNKGIVTEKLVSTKDNDINTDSNNDDGTTKEIELVCNEKNTGLNEDESNNSLNKENKERLLYEIYDYELVEDENNKKFKNLSFINKLKLIITNKCFMFSCMTRAIIFFIFKIIHIYLKKYSFEALNYTDELNFFYYYSLTTILAPFLGSLIGGTICFKFLGGYESKNSIWIIIFFGNVAAIFITLSRISINFYYLIVYIFGYFFSISAFSPTLSGYIINSVNEELKGFGSSFDSLIINILGKLPSPIIYGMINDKYKKDNPKFAWNKSLMLYYIGLFFIYLTCFFKWRINRNISKYKKNIVKKSMKDIYNYHRNSLVKAEKPIPKIDNSKNLKELENMEENSSK